MPTQGGYTAASSPKGTCPLLLCPGQVDGPCDPRQQPSQAEAAIMKGWGWVGGGEGILPSGTPLRLPGSYLNSQALGSRPGPTTDWQLEVGVLERVLRGRPGGGAGRSRAPQRRRPPRLLRQSGEEAAHGPRGGLSCAAPPPTRQCGRLQTAPRDLRFSRRAVRQTGSALGTQAGDWQRYRVCACAQVCRYVFVPLRCARTAVHVCGAWPVGMLVRLFAECIYVCLYVFINTGINIPTRFVYTSKPLCVGTHV